MRKIYYCIYFDESGFFENKGSLIYGNRKLAERELFKKRFKEIKGLPNKSLRETELIKGYQYILKNDFDHQFILANIVEEDVYETKKEVVGIYV